MNPLAIAALLAALGVVGYVGYEAYSSYEAKNSTSAKIKADVTKGAKFGLLGIAGAAYAYRDQIESGIETGANDVAHFFEGL